jgi:hypothetical protein
MTAREEGETAPGRGAGTALFPVGRGLLFSDGGLMLFFGRQKNETPMKE